MKYIIIISFIAFGQATVAQKQKTSLFIRSLHIIDYNLTHPSLFYSPVISGGFTWQYSRVFVDVGAFTNKNDVYGLYSFFGTTLHTSYLEDGWQLVKSGFGEVTYFPPQENDKYWAYTLGLNTALVKLTNWGNLSVPCTLGVAYSKQAFHLNFRVVVNLSISLGK